jgi:hypothetical protein
VKSIDSIQYLALREPLHEGHTGSDRESSGSVQLLINSNFERGCSEPCLNYTPRNSKNITIFFNVVRFKVVLINRAREVLNYQCILHETVLTELKYYVGGFH